MWSGFIVLLGALLPGSYGLVCPFGWSVFGGLCLRFIGDQNYFNSVSICRQLGGRLFEPRTQELSNLLNLLVSTGTTAWLGVNDNKYASDNQPVDYTQASYGYNYAYMTPTGVWLSSTTPSPLRRAFCELPRTNTECATVATIFVEDSFAVSNNEACRDACASTVNCKFWTFGLGQCGLRFYEAGDVVGGGIPGISSTGFPNSIVANGGRVIVGKAVKGVETASDCQKLCSDDAKCNSFTWTNIDLNFGGINTETCVFNYGKTLRKLPLPGFSGYQIVSGPACCNAKSACEKRDSGLTVSFTDSAGSSALIPPPISATESAEVVLTEKQLEEFRTEFEAMIKKIEAENTESTTTRTVYTLPTKVKDTVDTLGNLFSKRL